MTHQGLLLTSTQWAQLSELFGNNYLKKLKGKLLWLASDWEAALWYIQTVKCVDAHSPTHEQQQKNRTKENNTLRGKRTLSDIIFSFGTLIFSQQWLSIRCKEKQREDKCALPARVSVHTENVHFLKTDEEHFYLKVINASIRKYIHNQGFIFLAPNFHRTTVHHLERALRFTQSDTVSFNPIASIRRQFVNHSLT